MSSSPHGESAARWLDGKQRVMEERIASLVEVNSFTDNVDGGRRVESILRELFAISGLASRLKPSARYADHLLSPRAPRRRPRPAPSRWSAISTPCSRPGRSRGSGVTEISRAGRVSST